MGGFRPAFWEGEQSGDTDRSRVGIFKLTEFEWELLGDLDRSRDRECAVELRPRMEWVEEPKSLARTLMTFFFCCPFGLS